MELSKSESEIYDSLARYAEEKGFKLNPDAEMVGKIITGLKKISEAKGEGYCPCRLVTGNKDADAKIICPCEFHEEEIRENGHCHCYLFFAK